MKIEIENEHIENLAKANNYRINSFSKLERFMEKKLFDEVDENGATYLCKFIERLLHLAYEDDMGLERIEI